MKVLVVDDEAPARERLRQLLDDIDGFDCCADAANGEAALTIVNDERPDIVLLDIRMPGMDGIQTAHHMNALQDPPAIVFTTAYDEYAIEAFDARAIGYVLKPVRRTKLEAALSHAARLAGPVLREAADAAGVEARRKHICARTTDRLTLIPVDEISHFVADQKYVLVQHARGRTLIDESLKSLEEEFDELFVRIHRSALVAVDKIERVEKTGDGRTRVVMRDDSQGDDKELIISRRHIANVRRRLKDA